MMLKIFIDGRLAALKKDSSFDYVSENRLFTGADDFSLEIALPLKGCERNEEIFGKIFRKDLDPYKLVFDCEMVDGDFRKVGCVTIVEYDESEVKVQFLEGRSAQNFNFDFENVFINELELGCPRYSVREEVSPEWALDPRSSNYESVALPWVNGSGANDIIHNEVDVVYNEFVWASGVRRISWQPYLLFIAKRIAEAVGYSYDFSEWERDPTKRFFIICNSLPDSWVIQNYARALPKWSVDEFFSKLELFLGGEFNFDYAEKRISFSFSKSIDMDVSPVLLDQVVDEFSSEVSVEEPKCDYIEERSFKFKDQSDDMWQFYSCDWFVELIKAAHGKSAGMPITLSFREYDSLDLLIKDVSRLQNWDGTSGRSDNLVHSLFYAKDVDMYFIMRWHERWNMGPNSLGVYHWIFRCFLQPVNSFGPLLRNRNAEEEKEKDNSEELDFIPACIDYTDREHGFCLFLYPGNFAEEVVVDDSNWPWEDDPYRKDFNAVINSENNIRKGKESEVAEYYSSIFLAFWDGSRIDYFRSQAAQQPFPYVESVNIDQNWNVYKADFSLRLNDGSVKSRYRNVNLDTERKFTFKFLSDSIHSPRAVYYIRGHRYLCERLTYSFSEAGRSKLVKGEFWRIRD